MRIEQVQHPDAELVQQLVRVWESSMCSNHHFLSNDEITAISHSVAQALTSVVHLIVARKENNEPVGFGEIQLHKKASKLSTKLCTGMGFTCGKRAESCG
ncbi:hypothetical protein [Aeriscardovia aeriphila]|uniref:hypothetical protein n=1 Tax=Aeriscardovia aeriphila TaxID=218139 RepID=UPI0011D094AD|nr:hypothetical protein [Aeriscardovia aeriphila]NYI25085.1 hypothetical protein [Aeriscardovia aeriphila]